MSSPSLPTIPGQEASDCMAAGQYRTEHEIVISCLMTVLSCTWVSAHPDIPSQRFRSWVCWMERFFRAILALFLPEWTVALAIREMVEAFYVRDRWNGRLVHDKDPEPSSSSWYQKIRECLDTPFFISTLNTEQLDGRWTLTHSFLANMGGFELYKGGRYHKRISFGCRIAPFWEIQHEQPFELLLTDPGKERHVFDQIYRISERDVQDKSKGDFFTKILVILQTSWFGVQCLVRWHMNLRVTELEVITLGYVVLNLLVYIAYWYKPQNVGKAFPIHADLGVDLQNSKTHGGNYEPSDGISGTETSLTMSPLLTGVPPTEESLVAAEGKDSMAFLSRIRESSIRYPMRFQAPIAAITGAFFGGIHLAISTVTSTFSSTSERQRWCNWVYVITIASVLSAVMFIPFYMMKTKEQELRAHGRPLPLGRYAFSRGFGFLQSLVWIAYLAGRGALVKLAFDALQDLPRDALLNIPWTTLIPHF